MQNINEMTLEEGFAELDNMIKSLSDKNVPLEEAFAIYENGTKILNIAGKSSIWLKRRCCY